MSRLDVDVVVGAGDLPGAPPPGGQPRPKSPGGIAALVAAVALAGVLAALAVRGPAEVTGQAGETPLAPPDPSGLPEGEPAHEPSGSWWSGREWSELRLPGRDGLVAVAHGGDTWMAVTGSGRGVWVSNAARVWSYRPLPPVGPLRLPAAVVVPDEGIHDRLEIVTEGSQGVPERWTSLDGGRNWSRLAFPGRATVRGAAEVSGLALAFGRTGDRTAGVWELGGASIDPLPFHVDPGPGSEVRAVVESGGRVVAFGRTADGPAAWELVLEGWRPVELRVPRQGSAWEMGQVVVGAGGAVATLETPGGARLPIGSHDLVDWEALEGERVALLRHGGGGEVVGVDPERAVLAVLSPAGTGGPLPPPEGVRGGHLADMAFAGGVGVMVGWRDGDGTLWTTAPTPLAALPDPGPWEGEWVEAAFVPTGGAWYSVSFVEHGRGGLLAAGERMLRIPDLSRPGGVEEMEPFPGADLASIDGEVFAFGERGAAVLDGGAWRTLDLPFTPVGGITRIDGTWIATGTAANRAPALARSSDLRTWVGGEAPPDPARGGFLGASAPGVLLRWVPADPGARPVVEATVDGRVWEPVDGDPLASRTVAAVVVGRGPEVTSVALLGPGRRQVEVPSGIVARVDVSRDRLVAWARDEVLVETGVGWARLPTGILHGVAGDLAGVAVAEDGSVIALDARSDGVHLLRWRDPAPRP